MLLFQSVPKAVQMGDLQSKKIATMLNPISSKELFFNALLNISSSKPENVEQGKKTLAAYEDTRKELVEKKGKAAGDSEKQDLQRQISFIDELLVEASNLIKSYTSVREEINRRKANVQADYEANLKFPGWMKIIQGVALLFTGGTLVMGPETPLVKYIAGLAEGGAAKLGIADPETVKNTVTVAVVGMFAIIGGGITYFISKRPSWLQKKRDKRIDKLDKKETSIAEKTVELYMLDFANIAMRHGLEVTYVVDQWIKEKAREIVVQINKEGFDFLYAPLIGTNGEAAAGWIREKISSIVSTIRKGLAAVFHFDLHKKQASDDVSNIGA